MSIRRILAVFAVTLAVAWAGYSAYWFHAQGVLRKGVEAWAADRRAQGWVVEWSSRGDGGYPWQLRLDFESPRLVSPAGLSWRAESLSAGADPLRWTRVHLNAPGDHWVDWSGGSVRLNAVQARADLNLYRQGGLDDATVLLSGLTAEGVSAEPIRLDGLAVTWDPLPVLKPSHTQPSIRFSVTGHGIHLPALPMLPLDRDVALAEITGRVMGEVRAGSPAQSLAAWAADGGTVEIEHLSLDWAPMALEGDGTLALDPNGQPLAAMAARVRGFGPLMDRLAETRTLEPGAAQAAKMILLMMAKPDAQGRPSVNVPVNLQDGVVMFGAAPVARIPAVRW